MEKIPVVYWSGTGNTEMMANEIAQGIRSAGAEPVVVAASEADLSLLKESAKIAFGCPAMGSEVLEEGEFEPMFTEVEGFLDGKKLALFGSYDWGDGEWMRSWQERLPAGAQLFREGLIINNTPDAEGLAQCAEFGQAFVSF